MTTPSTVPVPVRGLRAARLVGACLVATGLLAGAPTGAAAGSEAASSPAGVQWFGTWAQGQAEAARTGRPILLTSAAPQCHGVPGIW